MPNADSRHAVSCLRLFRFVLALLITVGASSAFGFGSTSRFVIVDNEDTSSALVLSGSWASVAHSDQVNVTPVIYGENYRTTPATGGGESAAFAWNFGPIASSPGGNYSFEAFLPDTSGFSGNAVVYRLEQASFSLFGGCGAFATTTTFTTNPDSFEGRWMPIGTAFLSAGICYRLVLSNANNSGATLIADAVRAERLYESSSTIVDMPRVATAFAPGTVNITSTSQAAPTIVTTLTVTCPQVGQVLVTGSGESTAVTNVAGSNFNGLAYSIAKNSTDTDVSTVVQSSSLGTFNGDANRDFLNVQRIDTCTAGETITYRLTAFRAQTATGPTSFIWNGRLVAQYLPATGF